MAIIRTVTGDIDPTNLGITYGHDHLLFLPPPPYSEQDPDLRLDDVNAAIREVNYFKMAGGASIVEMSTVEMGRDPRGMRRISEETGVNIIAATGFNKGKFAASYAGNLSEDEIFTMMVKDLTQGMDGTTIKAGLIKVSTSLNEIQPVEEKILRAAIRAHHETGAPISTHTEAGSKALDQIQRFLEGGVSPDHLLIGHLDRRLEWDYLLEVAKTGVYLGFDQISKEKYYPDAVRIEMIQRLAAEGYGDRILLSGDLARKSYWPSFGFGYGPGLTYILWRFIPWLIEAGASRELVDNLLIHNAARLFAWAK